MALNFFGIVRLNLWRNPHKKFTQEASHKRFIIEKHREIATEVLSLHFHFMNPLS